MPRRVYVDGIWDLFHIGHVKHFMELKNLDNKNNFLIVGIISDKVAEGYKRTPIYNEEHRKIWIESCKYVDEIITNPPLVLNEEFMTNHNIDLVCHGFSDINDTNKQDEFFNVPKKLGKFRAVKYNTGISTTEIIKKIQNRKKEDILTSDIDEKRVNENIILDITTKSNN